jgi:hypothetical protein
MKNDSTKTAKKPNLTLVRSKNKRGRPMIIPTLIAPTVNPNLAVANARAMDSIVSPTKTGSPDTFKLRIFIFVYTKMIVRKRVYTIERPRKSKQE